MTQATLPGVIDAETKAMIAAMEDYVEARNAFQEASKDVQDKGKALLVALKENGFDEGFTWEGQFAHIVKGEEKAQVKKVKKGKDADGAD